MANKQFDFGQSQEVRSFKLSFPWGRNPPVFQRSGAAASGRLLQEERELAPLAPRVYKGSAEASLSQLKCFLFLVFLVFSPACFLFFGSVLICRGGANNKVFGYHTKGYIAI